MDNKILNDSELEQVTGGKSCDGHTWTVLLCSQNFLNARMERPVRRDN